MLTNKVWARGYASVDLDGNENSVLIKVSYALSIQNMLNDFISFSLKQVTQRGLKFAKHFCKDSIVYDWI